MQGAALRFERSGSLIGSETWPAAHEGLRTPSDDCLLWHLGAIVAIEEGAVFREYRVTDIGVLAHIRQLNSQGAVSLARSLLHAEAGRMGVPIDSVSMSGRVFVGDEGIDGRSDLPAGTLLPEGQQVWQVKSGPTKPSAAAEFDNEKHPGLIRAIRDGANYVLFWTHDPEDPVLQSVTSDFETAVRSIRADAVVTVLTGDRISRLCHAHLAVVASIPTMQLRGVVNIPTWGSSPDFDVPYASDAVRDAHIEAIRQHVRSEGPDSSIHVFGDTGVGKTRMVYEALLHDDISPRVLVARDPAHFDRTLMNLVAASPEHRLILVVDDCDPVDRESLRQYADMSRGRLRLVTIGSRSTRDRVSPDNRYLETLPLEVSASKSIAESVGLSEADAGLVAEYTEGYPKLARVLAEAIRHQGPASGILSRIRGHEAVGSVLSGMLGAGEAGPLGLLAMFERLGFEGELATEVAIACEVFGVDEALMREAVERELGRFVSRAGRYRLVSPRLFAVWLARAFMEDQRGELSAALEALPSGLRDRVINQMEAFSGDELVAAVLDGMLRGPPFVDSPLASVDEGAARMIHIAAIVEPEIAAQALDRLIGGASVEDLNSFTNGRREAVWALEILLWFEATYHRAATCLLRLALAETEHWSNNATGVLQGSFGVVLGGTATPYLARVEWAREAIRAGGEGVARVLIPGLARALDRREMRSATNLGTRSAPPEWRPSTREEDVQARTAAWDLLIELGGRGVELDLLADAISNGLRGGLAWLGSRVIDDLAAVDWTDRGRVQIADGLAAALRFESPPVELAASIRRLRQQLIGDDLEQRIEFVLAATPWELRDDDEERSSTGPPAEIERLARDIGQAGSDAIARLIDSAVDGNEQSVYVLFQELGRTTGEAELITAASESDLMTPAALVGLLRGLAESKGSDWADSELSRWAEDAGLSPLVVRAAHSLPPSDTRCAIATRAVAEGAVDGSELGRFVYGAWASGLSAECVVVIAQLLRESAGPGDIPNALGILEQWLDQHPEPADATMAEICEELIEASIAEASDPTGMGYLSRSRILERLGLPHERRLKILLAQFEALDSFLDEEATNLLISLAAEDTLAVASAILSLIVGDGQADYVPRLMWLEQLKVITLMHDHGDTDVVVQQVMAIDQSLWTQLLHHVDFGRREPDPVFLAMVESELGDEAFVAAATLQCLYPGSGWTGSESSFLAERKAILESWKRDSGSRQLAELIDQMMPAIDEYIVSASEREAERGY